MGKSATTEALVDRVYEAAFVPEQWPKALQAIADANRCASGAIGAWSASQEPHGFKATQLTRAVVENHMSGSAGQGSKRFAALHSAPDIGFTCIDTLLTPEEIDRDPIQSLLRNVGLESQVATAIAMPSGELVCVSFERYASDGPFDSHAMIGLNALRPHLARAGLIAARLGLERAQTTVATLHQIGLPAAVAARSGRVLASNDLFNALPMTFLPTAYDGVALNDPDADALFQAAINAAKQHDDALVGSIPIAAREGQEALVVHVLPLRRAAHEIFSGGDVLIVATAVRANGGTPAPSILMGLFDLTPAEVKLAVALANGSTLQQAALASSIRLTTARTYLDRIFRKTGTHQQSQLVALLKSAHGFTPR